MIGPWKWQGDVAVALSEVAEVLLHDHGVRAGGHQVHALEAGLLAELLERRSTFRGSGGVPISVVNRNALLATPETHPDPTVSAGKQP
jgi:hypothetical protein